MKAVLLFWLAAFACSSRDSGVGSRESEKVPVSSDARPPTTDSRTPVEFYSSADIARVAEQTTGRTFGTEHPTFHYVESRRVESGSPEIHDRWADVTIVQSGRATLLSGGTVTGGNVTEPGEHRGGTINGGATHLVQAGDMFVVPAGTPHQFQLGQGDSIRYLTIKIAKP